jgi:hypothetical protein
MTLAYPFDLGRKTLEPVPTFFVLAPVHRSRD